MKEYVLRDAESCQEEPNYYIEVNGVLCQWVLVDLDETSDEPIIVEKKC